MERQVTKGMYINNALDHVEKVKGRDYRTALCQRLKLPFACHTLGDYPVPDLTRTLDAAAPDLFPGHTREQAAYEWGVLGFEAFSNSFIGKVGLALVTHDLERFLFNIPSYYAMSGRYGPITVTRGGPRTYRVAFRDLNGYTEYQHGILTTVLKKLGHPCRLTHERRSFEDRGAGDIWANADLVVESLAETPAR
jgi:uncharacterized protein (TIGR02265 family)